MQPEIDAQSVLQIPSERRRHPRFRLSVPITIHRADGVNIPAISMEISQSGMSAITAGSLKIGDAVELEPIVATKLAAIVRRNLGKVYGLEFLNLTPEEIQRITERCRMLPRYRGKLLGI